MRAFRTRAREEAFNSATQKGSTRNFRRRREKRLPGLKMRAKQKRQRSLRRPFRYGRAEKSKIRHSECLLSQKIKIYIYDTVRPTAWSVNVSQLTGSWWYGDYITCNINQLNDTKWNTYEFEQQTTHTKYFKNLLTVNKRSYRNAILCRPLCKHLQRILIYFNALPSGVAIRFKRGF